MTQRTGLREGDCRFLKLEAFSPAWRQALVISSKDKKSRVVFVVRVLDKEIEDKARSVAFLEHKQQKYILVEGKASQTRMECNQPYRALEVDPVALLEVAKGLLEAAEDPPYMTASEDLPAETKETEKAKGSARDLETSESGSEASQSEEDDVLELLMAAGKKKGKQERGMSSADKPRESTTSRTRCPILEKNTKVKTDGGDGLEKMLKQACLSGNADLTGAGLNTLINLEVLRTLKDKKGMRKAEDSDKSSHADSDLSSTDSQEDRKVRGAGKALRDFRSYHRKMRRKPLKHVKKYIKEVESTLGVSGPTPYSLSDYTRRLNWGKQKTLMRVHYGLSELLQVLMKGKLERGALMTVQLLRAVHQVSLDQGSWQAASLLLAHSDPLERPRFGGEPEQLEKIASYLKAMQELEKRSQVTQKEDNPGGGKGKGRNNKGKSEEVDQ